MLIRELLVEDTSWKEVDSFLHGLTPDDVGVDTIGNYRVHYEGFTDWCQSDAQERCSLPPTDSRHLASYDDVYDEVLHDFIERENGKQPVKSGLVGSEDYPIFYAVFEAGLNEGPVWNKIKKTAATGAIAGALGYGAMHNAMKPADAPQVERPPLEINIPGNDIKQPEQPEPKKAEPKAEKPMPSTATNADPKMEKLVFQVALKDGLRGHELAQFMAQVAHETLGFTRMVEDGDSNYFKKYDPKHSPNKAKILGNVKPGDGERYKGRGFLQITGRYNYKKASEAIGVDLVKNPKLAADPKVAAEIAVWFWKSRVSPNVEDFSDTIGVTTQINPNMQGLGDRDLNYHSYAKRMKLATSESIEENFADGKKPGRKGLAKRVGVNCKQSVTKLRKIASNSTGEKQRMAHWCANMKGGKKK